MEYLASLSLLSLTNGLGFNAVIGSIPVMLFVCGFNLVFGLLSQAGLTQKRKDILFGLIESCIEGEIK